MQKPRVSKGIMNNTLVAASIGFCSIGTAVIVYLDGTIYGQVRPEDVAEIVEEHLEKGRVLERLAQMMLNGGRSVESRNWRLFKVGRFASRNRSVGKAHVAIPNAFPDKRLTLPYGHMVRLVSVAHSKQ